MQKFHDMTQFMSVPDPEHIVKNQISDPRNQQAGLPIKILEHV